ncbi:LytTR family transcriptional regulator [Ruegeria pomeroyi]|nr:LytTR family transcriptional regulator [Ruegeria pomeroyi]
MSPQKPLTLHFLNGDSISLAHRDAVTLMTCPVGVFIVLFSATIVRVLNISLLNLSTTFPQTLMLGLGLAAALWTALLYLSLTLVWLARVMRHAIALPVSLIGLTTNLLSDFTLLWSVSGSFDPGMWDAASVSRAVLLAYAIHLGFEFLFAALVLPKARARLTRQLPADAERGDGAPSPSDNAAPRAQGPHVILDGETVPADAIKLVEADEHYVFVHHDGRKTHVRESFGALVRALDPAAGMQVHKSYWVAFDHIQQVRPKRDGGLRLILKDQTAIPGARRRARAFREAYGKQRRLRAPRQDEAQH